MKKRTIYLPEWLDEWVEQQAQGEMRSVSAQVVYLLMQMEKLYNPPSPYFARDGGVRVRDIHREAWL